MPIARTPMPAAGRAWSDVRAELLARGADDAKWRDGKTAVFVFNAGEDVERAQAEAYTLYMAENGLGARAFPSLVGMEREVIGMALSLLQAPDDAAGCMTSGGSDSIAMAMKAARDFARSEGRARTRGNIVLPRSAHLAFDKAAHLMDLEIRRSPLTTDGAWIADPAAMARAVDDDTVMLVGSAPSFPHGVIDPIEALAAIARDRGVWLHVDACVGGFFAPFARMNGVPVPAFDFAVDGVSSMSADLHKYGYCAKGASTVLFRSQKLYDHMPFDFDGWSGAPMRTPTLAGTRPGGAIAAAWAVLTHLGEDGYRRLQGTVCETRARLEEGVKALGFEILGTPLLGIMAFRTDRADAAAIWSEMSRRGWVASMTREPASLHLMLSPKHAETVDAYLADLAEATRAAEGASVPPGEAPRYA